MTRGKLRTCVCIAVPIRSMFNGFVMFFQVEKRQRIKTDLPREEEESSPSQSETTSGKLASHGLPRMEFC